MKIRQIKFLKTRDKRKNLKSFQRKKDTEAETKIIFTTDFSSENM